MSAKPGVLAALERGMPPVATHGETHAVLAMRHGIEVFAAFGTDCSVPCGPDVTHISWSMAKSMTHALVGFMVADGRLDIEGPGEVPEWQADARRAITMRQLLEMRSGLDWIEAYVEGEESHVIDMLFGEGSGDHAAYAARRPLAHAPGAFWNYSSGTTNIICRILGDLVGGASASERRIRMNEWVNDRLFAPLGMSSSTAKFDSAGNFVGSSYVYATAADFARFGRMYITAAHRLPPGWVDLARTTVSVDPETHHGYSHHWWTWPSLPGAFVATGFEGQYTIVVPEDDLVIVRLGKTPSEIRTNVVADLVALVHELRG